MLKNTNYMLTKTGCVLCEGLKKKLSEIGFDYDEINMSAAADKERGEQLLSEMCLVDLLCGGLPLLLCVDARGYVSRHVQGNPSLTDIKKSLGIKTGRRK